MAPQPARIIKAPKLTKCQWRRKVYVIIDRKYERCKICKLKYHKDYYKNELYTFFKGFFFSDLQPLFLVFIFNIIWMSEPSQMCNLFIQVFLVSHFQLTLFMFIVLNDHRLYEFIVFVLIIVINVIFLFMHQTKWLFFRNFADLMLLSVSLIQMRWSSSYLKPVMVIEFSLYCLLLSTVFCSRWAGDDHKIHEIKAK